MKLSLRNIAEWFRAAKKLKAANSYIDFMEGELQYQRKLNSSNLFLMADRCKQIDQLEERNIVLNDRNKRLLNMLEEMRGLLHQRGATDAESEFIRVCKDIYTRGKMLSQMRFDASMYTIIEQRKMACINRNLPAEKESRGVSS